MSNAEYIYNIRQVLDLTGISEFKLRAWELRYKALKPERTATGRRLYSTDQVLRLSALIKLTTQGHRIGNIVHLSTADLKSLIENQPLSFEASTESLANDIQKSIELALSHDWDKLRKLIYSALDKHSIHEYIFNFVLPLVAQVNRLIMQNKLGIAQEHIISAYIKEVLHSIKSTRPSRKANPFVRLILATPEGDYHEIGLLIASVLAHHHGIAQIYLGPNVPKTELAETAIRYKASHLIVACTASPEMGAKDEVLNYIHFLNRQLPPKVQLWLGGVQTQSLLNMSLSRPHIIFANLQALDEQMQKASKKPRSKR